MFPCSILRASKFPAHLPATTGFRLLKAELVILELRVCRLQGLLFRTRENQMERR